MTYMVCSKDHGGVDITSLDKRTPCPVCIAEQRIATLETATHGQRGRTEYSMRMESLVDELQGRVKELEAERGEWKEQESSTLGELRRAIEQRDAAVAERDRLREALNAVKRGDCWCEAGVGNPMMRRHSPACEQARKAVEASDGQ